MKKTLLSLSLAAVLLGGCASTSTLSTNAVFQQYPAVSEAQSLITKAKEDNLAFYSPEQMKEANRVYENALKDAKADKISATELAEEAVARVNAARAQSNKVKYTFEEIFIAREKAMQVNAQSVASEQFNDAEKMLAKAIAQLEIGEDAKAKRDIEAIKNQYLEIELNALKKNMLSFAKQAVADAQERDLNDIAPRTFVQAQDELKLAQDTLDANRTDTAKANVHSNRAIWLIKRAEGIADINAYFENAKFDEEQKILWYQDQLSTVVAPINSQVQFNNTNKEVVAQLRQQVSSVLTNNQALMTSNQTLRDKVTSIQQEMQQIASDSQIRASQLERDNAQAIMAAQLEREKMEAAKKADDARFAAVQSMFSEDEATVYRQRDNVLIRAQGFSFKSGGSEIESSNFVMLNKITEAIKRFPNAKIVVTGHTDSTGSAELNLALSKARAETVSNFITKVSDIDSSRVTFNGFGKEKPVASNETAEGRAENRRVEILIVNN
jgi:outer membrane protein OmpA-like peptidoglycan-associated protein